jgi:hypothetical protein
VALFTTQSILAKNGVRKMKRPTENWKQCPGRDLQVISGEDLALGGLEISTENCFLRLGNHNPAFEVIK